MTLQFQATSKRVAATAVFALVLVTAACGTTTGTALAPAAGPGAQRADTSATLAGDAYLTADGQFGVGVRTRGASAGANDLHVCTTSGSCLEP